MTAVGLAEVVGISPQAISQYENEKSSPSSEVLDAIAQAVNLPEHFFMLPLRQPDRGQVFYRSMSSATKSARARAEHRFSWLRDIVGFVSPFVKLPTPNFPDLRIGDPMLLSDLEIEDAAEQVRAYWRVGNGSVGNMVALLENQGAVMARDALGAETLDGLSEFVVDEQRPYIILGTDKGTPVRWRFDAAHELGHMVLHQAVDASLMRRAEYFKRVEEQAHRFAAAFLLPLAPFGDDLFAVNLDQLRAIKPKWGVSISMMIVRARHAGLISEEAERRLWINLSRRGWRREEPGDASTEPEQPRVLKRAFELLLDSRMQTPEDVLANLALPARDIESLAGLVPGYLTGAFAPVTLLSPSSKGESDVTDATTPGEVIQLPLRPRTS